MHGVVGLLLPLMLLVLVKAELLLWLLELWLPLCSAVTGY
jgi:hypothetical protein